MVYPTMAPPATAGYFPGRFERGHLQVGYHPNAIPMTLFQPHYHCDALDAVPLDHLWQQGLRGLLLDLDNTLAHHDQYDLTPAARQWLQDAKSHGFRIALYSNAQQSRIRRMAALLELPETPRAYKPLNIGLRGNLRTLGIPASQVALCGDQLFTDLLAAKWGGMTAVLIEPLSRREWAHTRGFRRLEYALGRREVGAMPTLARDPAPAEPADSTAPSTR